MLHGPWTYYWTFLSLTVKFALINLSCFVHFYQPVVSLIWIQKLLARYDIVQYTTTTITLYRLYSPTSTAGCHFYLFQNRVTISQTNKPRITLYQEL